MITKSKLEKLSTWAIGIATVLMLVWAVYVSMGEHTQEAGKVERTFVENGVSKLEFVADTGETKILESNVVIDKIPVGKKVKLRLLKLPLLPPRITQIEQEN
jgi:hypothetical protein